ncbi:MAG: 2-keto-4-pentenoate hydratase [Gammaproteobacteria bacterium]|nr:2-keto-4-pentenoate hydratase [Gammaproteobacteria bacterium]
MDHQSAMLAARSLTAARRSGTRIDSLPAPAVPRSHDDGYHIQDAVAACFGEQVGAWKVGATHPNAQASLGVDGPVAARLFSQNLLFGDQRLADTFMVRGLEAEYAFLMGADLPPAGVPYSREQIAAAVASVHPAIEIVDTRFTAAQQGVLAIADNVNDALWIYGEGVSDWRALDRVNAEVTLQVNGEVVVRGSGAEVLGDPMTSLEWLVNEHAGAREGVRAGQYITTGSCTGLYKSPAGCTARATFAGLGELNVMFTAPGH